MEKRKLSEAHMLNRLIALLYTVVALMLVASYLIEVMKGSRTLAYFLFIFLVLLIPGVINIVVHIKSPENAISKYILLSGYLVMYCFTMFTAATPMVFTFILPMILVMMLTRDLKLMITLNLTAFFINVIQVVYNLTILGRGDDPLYVINLKIQLAATFAFCLITIASSYVDVRIYREKIDMIRNHENQTNDILNMTMATVKEMNLIITNIDSDAGELERSSDKCVSEMKEVYGGTASTTETIQDQLNMTSTIQEEINVIQNHASNFSKLSGDASSVITEGMGSIRELNKSVEDNNKGSREMLTNVNGLKDKVAKINEIIEIIESISESTNLLSLNAAIEAARAGESGRGFAVVANEIRGLASSTADSVKEIQTIIQSVTENTEIVFDSTNSMIEGFKNQNKLIDNTRVIFDTVSEKTDLINRQAGELNSKVHALDSSNAKIVDSIRNISAISEETLASATQTEDLNRKNLGITKEIKQLTGKLTGLAGKLDTMNS